MWCLALGSAAALAGVPVDLPDTEVAADWVGVLALGGLDWAEAGAPIVVGDRGDTWVVTVSDPTGARRSATVPRPRTPDQREDLVWLVVSLRSAVAAPAPPPEPEPPPRPPAPLRPTPAPRPEEVRGAVATGPRVADPLALVLAPADAPPEPADGPTHAVLAATPDPPAPPPPTPAAPTAEPEPPRARRPGPTLPSPPDDPGLRPWVRVGSGVGLRSGVDPRLAGAVAAGIARDRLGVGLAAGTGPRGDLPRLGPGRGWSGVELAVEGWSTPGLARLGVAGGVEVRRFDDGGVVVARGVMPFVRGELAAGLYVGHRLSIEPGIAVRLDVGVTELQVDGIRVADLPARVVSPGIAIRWR